MATTNTTHTIGRRKEAVCRVYLTPGTGKWDLNGRTLGDYFQRPALVSAIQQPFTVTDTLGSFDVQANLTGGWPDGPGRRAPPRDLACPREDQRRPSPQAPWPRTPDPRCTCG